ncbi:hypothetical protein L1887_28140 [Cichorium endivia]|nr:hypothetical protein L1887_28140 [Cichorium endivia]
MPTAMEEKIAPSMLSSDFALLPPLFVFTVSLKLKQFLNMSGEEEENSIEDRRRTGCLEEAAHQMENEEGETQRKERASWMNSLQVFYKERRQCPKALTLWIAFYLAEGMKAKPSMMNKVKKGSTKLVASTANFMVYAFQMVGGTFGFQLHLQHRKA